MNKDDQEFFSKIKQSNSSQSDYFIVVPPVSKNKTYFNYSNDKFDKKELGKVSPSSFNPRTVAAFSIPSLHCGIIYGSSIYIQVDKNPYDSSILLGSMTREERNKHHKNWDKEQKIINKNVHQRLIRNLDNLLRLYLEKMKNYCAKKEGNYELKIYDALDSKLKINNSLEYLENINHGLGLVCGNTHVDALQLLVKAHKTLIHCAILADPKKKT